MSKKPDGRKAKKTNANEDKQPEKARYQKPQKQPKVPGPRPASYTPNHQREVARKHQALAHEIARETARFPMFVAGAEDQYLIGRNGDGGSESVELVVKMTKGKTGQFLVMERSDGIFMPHVWLFIPLDECHFTQGRVGDEQYHTLKFLKSVLYADIKAAKQAYWEARQAAQPADTGEKAAETEKVRDGKNIIPIQDAILERDTRPVRDLLSVNPLGTYNLSDKTGALILELKHTIKTGKYFAVKKISSGHQLAKLYVEGSIIPLFGIANREPQLDGYIRDMLEKTGIRLVSIKEERNTHAGVTEGLPNVMKETLLAA